MKKRVLSAFMALCLMLTMLPVSALAAETEDGQVSGSGASTTDGDSGLTPSDKYYTFGGTELGEDNEPDITLRKQAVLNNDGTYRVTLTATAERVITAKPTEVVFVIDGSNSMYWCDEKPEGGDIGWIGDEDDGHYHGNGDWGRDGVFCTLVEKGEEDSRWEIALKAIETMQKNLGNEGISYKYVVFGGTNKGNPDGSRIETPDTLAALQKTRPKGGTHLSAGVEVALNQFSNSNNDTNKVMIVVADGDSNDGYPQDRRNGRFTEFGQFKNEGGEVYTVGFTFSNPDFSNISSGNGYSFDATNAEQLNLRMEQISENIKGLISDPLGEGVKLVDEDDIQVTKSDHQEDGGSLWVTGDTINWTSAKGLNGTVTLTYNVALKDSEKKAGIYTVLLNGDAKLNYIYNSEYHSIPFPVPEATVRAATLDVVVSNRTVDEQWLNLGVTDAKFVTGSIPSVGQEYATGKWVASVTVTAKNGDQDVDGVTLDDLNNPAPYAYTVTVTLTDQEPEEPNPLNGTAVTVQVFVDGKPVTDIVDLEDLAEYVDLSRDTTDTTFNEWEETVDAFTGYIICDFNYNKDADNGGYDCVDIKVDPASGYVLQGVHSYQSYGKQGTDNVRDQQDGTYTIDNVTGVGNDTDPDVKIYLRTAYSVKYLVNNQDSSVMDTNVYITGEDVKDSDVDGNQALDSAGESAWMDWKNDDLLTEITVKDLPTVESDKTIEGWWLNDEDCTDETTYDGNTKVQVSEAITGLTDDDHVIKFYAETDDADQPGLSVEKKLTSVTRCEDTLTSLENFVAQVGDTLHYTITVTNTGNTVQSGTITDTFTVGGESATLESVRAEDVPTGCTVSTAESWTFEGLPAESSFKITADYTVQPGDKSIRNSVDVDSNDPNTPEDPNPDDDTVETNVASLTVEKTADREMAFVGDTITYTITVTNTGNMPITGVVRVEDSMWGTGKVETIRVDGVDYDLSVDGGYWNAVMPDEHYGSVESLAPGESWTCIYTYTVTAADAEAGKVTNVARAESDQTKDPDPEDPDDPGSDTTETEILPSAAEVTKHVVTNSTSVPEEILAKLVGENITYPAPAAGEKNPQIVTNAGETITLLYEISVIGKPGAYFTVTEESGANYIGAVGASGEILQTLSEPPQYVGQIGEGSHYATLYFTKTFEIAENTTILTNSITAIVNGKEDETKEEVDVVKPGLNIEKAIASVIRNDEALTDLSNYKAEIGDVITYRITVTNTGKTAITDTVTVTDSMWGTGKVETIQIPGVPYNSSVKNGYWNVVMQNGPLGTVEELKGGESWTCTYSYTVTAKDDAAAGVVDNAATVTADNGDTSTDELNTPVLSGVSITKTANDTSVNVGDTVTYTVTVTNTGDVPLTNIVVKDNKWTSGMTIRVAVNGSTTDVSLTGNTYTHKGTLAADAVMTITYSLTLNNAGTNTNNVTVTGNLPEGATPETVTDQASEDVSVTRPSTGGGSSRPSRPTLNTKDHYSYIIGYSDGYLRPYGSITRGEVATIFFRLLTDDSREEYWSQVNDYSDCDSDLWCNNAISTLTNMGIIDGFSDGTFRPYAKITRAQFAKIAVGFFETTREDYQGYFTDVDIDAWYTEYVEAAARVGLIEGFGDGTFRPNTNITRAQACVIVNRALGRAPDEDRLLDEDEMITWPDNNPDDWFYADMQEATNSHDYTWTTVSGDKVENWTDKLPQRNWAALEHAWSTAHSAPGGEVTQ